MADLHVRDYSPWEGWQVEGWPTTVILRGKVMVANGQLLIAQRWAAHCPQDRSEGVAAPSVLSTLQHASARRRGAGPRRPRRGYE